MTNHLSALDSFFHLTGDGELTREKTPKGGWYSQAKDVRLARGYVLRATCKRRFLGWRSSVLELSEREVSDTIGPHALRLAAEETREAIFTPPIPIPLNAKGLTSLDAFIGNDDGNLIRQSKDFSHSCSQVTLCRGTLLLASLPRADNSIALSIIVLEIPELNILKEAEEKEIAWKREMDEKARLEKNELLNNQKQLLSDDNDEIIITKMIFCCFPIKQKQKKKNYQKNVSNENNATNTTTTTTNNNNNNTTVTTTNQMTTLPVEIGTPKIPAMHQEAVDHTVRQIAQAASSETWDPAWRRLGSSDGLTWSLRDGAQTVMVRGTIRAPARSVFEYIWSDDSTNLLSIEPRLSEMRMIVKDVDGSGHTKTQSRTIAKEWSFAAGLDEITEATFSVLRHYHVHSDGTIFIVELGGNTSGGLVIAASQDDELSCHVAWVETTKEINNTTTNSTSSSKRSLASWAIQRTNLMQAKLLGDRLHNLARFGLSKAPYSDFESALSRGVVVNFGGSSGGIVKITQSSGTALMKDKIREYNELSSKINHSEEAWNVIVSQIETALDFLNSSIPEERKRYSQSLNEFGDILREFLKSSRSHSMRNVAQYIFDCIMMWLLTTLPTQESWVEILAEQLVMRNVEAQTTFGRIDTDRGDNNNRISQIIGKNRERLPSL